MSILSFFTRNRKNSVAKNSVVETKGMGLYELTNVSISKLSDASNKSYSLQRDFTNLRDLLEKENIVKKKTEGMYYGEAKNFSEMFMQNLAIVQKDIIEVKQDSEQISLYLSKLNAKSSLTKKEKILISIFGPNELLAEFAKIESHIIKINNYLALFVANNSSQLRKNFDLIYNDVNILNARLNKLLKNYYLFQQNYSSDSTPLVSR